MGYVANHTLKWGDEWLEPGDVVPVEEGRSYALMLYNGEITEVPDSAQPEGAKRTGAEPYPLGEPSQADDAEKAAPTGEDGAPDYSALTKAKLVDELAARQVEHDAKANKAALVELLVADDAEKAAQA